VDVGVEREARRVVPEPPLHLLRVRSPLEEHRGAGVPEGMEACPRSVRFLGRRTQHAAAA
jgi:hypothetical protein